MLIWNAEVRFIFLCSHDILSTTEKLPDSAVSIQIENVVHKLEAFIWIMVPNIYSCSCFIVDVLR